MIDKQDSKNFIARLGSFVINIILTFFISSFIINNVGHESYGFVGLGNDFLNYVQILTIALNSMAARFITFEYEKNKYINASKFASSLLVANVVMAAVISVLGSFIIFNVSSIVNINQLIVFDVQILWIFILCNFSLSLLGTVFQIAIFCKKRFDLEALINIFSCVFKAVVLVVCYSFFPAYIWYVGFATLISSVCAFVYNIKYTKYLMPRLEFSISHYDKTKLLILLKAGGWNSITQVGVVLSSGLDSLITNLYVGSSPMGLLSVSKTVPNYLFAIISNVSNIFTPNFIKYFANDNKKSIVEHLLITTKILSMVTVILVTVFISVSKCFYEIWVPNIDIDSLCLISFTIAIGYLFVMPANAIWSIYTALNKIKISSLYLIMESFLNVGIELALIQFIQNSLHKILIIVGVSSVLMLIRAFFFIPFYTSKCLDYKCSFFYSIYWKNLLLFFVLTFIGTNIMKALELLNITRWSVLMLGVVIIASLATFGSTICIFNKSEQHKVINLITNKLFRKDNFKEG